MLIGFCIYFKRSALNEIGFFDAKTFKRGYGEEIDWCLRARAKGYKLIISEGAYVYHVGGTSFGNEKKELIDNASKIIDNKYPNYMQELNYYIRNHPLYRMRVQMSSYFKIPLKHRIRYKLKHKKNKWFA
ncbi:hypothetical protein CHH51_18460 [Terribacillus saccharophilus]|nr:hypothetical protein CHH51_18460 [Terribacillus saccharophilus]